MAFTVKQVAAMSGVSVRALHFYDETGLLKPAYHGANGYRYYEEPQLLKLQQILFYRELGFELTGSVGGPRAAHVEEDEWIYIVDGELDFVIGEKRMRLRTGESIFIPKKTSHAWATATGKPAKIINVYQPAGKLEEFFAAVS